MTRVNNDCSGLNHDRYIVQIVRLALCVSAPFGCCSTQARWPAYAAKSLLNAACGSGSERATTLAPQLSLDTRRR